MFRILFASMSAFVFMGLLWCDNTSAQPFTIERVPVNIKTRVDADVVRNGSNLNLNLVASVTVRDIDQVISSIVSQIQIPECHYIKSPLGLTVKSSSVRQGPTSNSIKIYVMTDTCLGEATAEATADVKLVERKYFALRVTDVQVRSNFVVERLARAYKAKMTSTIESTVKRINAGLRSTQVAAYNVQPRFRAAPVRDPEVSVSLFGSLTIQVHVGGNMPTSVVDAYLNPPPALAY